MTTHARTKRSKMEHTVTHLPPLLQATISSSFHTLLLFNTITIKHGKLSNLCRRGRCHAQSVNWLGTPYARIVGVLSAGGAVRSRHETVPETGVFHWLIFGGTAPRR